MDHKKNKYSTGLEWHDNKIKELADLCSTFEHQPYIKEILTTVVKMGLEKTDNIDLKLVNTALKDMCYSFLKLSAYRSIRKVIVFGSARTLEDDPVYIMAQKFSKRIVDEDYMVITGAGPGVMEAGNRGAGRAKSFGVNINLPFEQEANPYIDNDHKLINFNYFFTRKLIFIKESCATAIFPGGFGTLDEAFENMTLFQTGKSVPRPILLMEPEGGTYWTKWQEFMCETLLKPGYISETDLELFQICYSIEDAVEVITKFYSVYHSIRNIDPFTVIRLNRPISQNPLDQIREEFKKLFVDGELVQQDALPEEVERNEFPELPRLVFRFEHRDYGLLKRMLDRLNHDDKLY